MQDLAANRLQKILTVMYRRKLLAPSSLHFLHEGERTLKITLHGMFKNEDPIAEAEEAISNHPDFKGHEVAITISNGRQSDIRIMEFIITLSHATPQGRRCQRTQMSQEIQDIAFYLQQEWLQTASE